MTTGSDLLASLNPAQRHAVELPGGPLLILAGPGSGKTRVIAHRIAYLVQEHRVPPWRLLAVTFTNKAAREMRERIEALLGDPARDLMMGTFHSICARILRRDGEAIGLTSDFAIFDTDDQQAVMKQLESELSIDTKRFPPRMLLSAISAAKNERIDPRSYELRVDNYFQEVVARVYPRYQQALERNAAVDFDDLLGHTLAMLEGSDAVRERYAERYLHVLIDEFQDTNVVQYELSRLLASGHGNITAVGDPDQSIYSWRAADIRNITNFERDFPGTQVVLLEQNYRSTGHILRSAHAVITKGAGRRQRELWTDNPDGHLVVVRECADGDEEGYFIANEIRRLITEQGLRPADFAVMYRTNAQSRAVEEACIQQGIRYRIVGGTRFYDRAEIRDLLAYLRLVHNPADSVAFRRIVNVPARGLGDRTVQDLVTSAATLGLSPFDIAARVAQGESGGGLPTLRPQARVALVGFVQLIDQLAAARTARPVSALIDLLLADLRYRQYLEASDEMRAEARWENVQELRNVATQYEDVEGGASLASFLEEIALVADIEDPSSDVPDAVTLTTLHAAKGLEYPVVFMPGLEEGLLPHFRALDDPPQMEEERRVCYVGMTRAKERLYMTRALRRLLMGSFRANPPSRFLGDLPREELSLASRERTPMSMLTARERRAALASREREQQAPAGPSYRPGEHVQHAQWGPGTVVAVMPSGDDQQITVAFAGQGVKRLLASLAPLTREAGDTPE